MELRGLLDDRLLFVTGKGGTGKTTAAAALALLLAAKGKRTILCEVDNQRPSLPTIVGSSVGFAPVRVRERLDAANLVWPDTLVAYLQRMIPVGRVVQAVLTNDMVRRFLDFVPGSRELVTLSAIVDLRERYDVVVVDLPASGHAFSMLDITRSALGLFRAGPVRSRVQVLRAALQDPTTRMVFVALPEEMVVNETLETVQKMREAELLGGAPLVVLNKATVPSFSADESVLLDRLSAAGLGAEAEEFLAAGRWERVLEEASAEAISRLEAAFGAAPALVGAMHAVRAPRDVVQEVAVALGRPLGLTRRDVAWGPA